MFPQQKIMLILPTAITSISSIKLDLLNNGKYLSPISKYIGLMVVSNNLIEKYSVIHNQLTTIKNNYLRSTLNTMTITPTQNKLLFLRNYMNTAVI